MQRLVERPRFVALFPLLALALLPVGSTSGQTGNESASRLIRSLSTNGRPTDVNFRCGLITGPLWERKTANKLVQLGKTALPDIERSLDSIEKKGSQSGFDMHWLFFAYARILGPAAAPRLIRMTKNPKLADARRSLDDAVALSLGITSYISGIAIPPASSACRLKQPKDGLDEVVESLEHGDLAELQNGLGPEAREALDGELQTRSWETLWHEIWHPRPGVHYAVGYRFGISGRWSEPEETLEQSREEYRGPFSTLDKFSLETQFTDSEGKDCAQYKVDFSVKAPLVQHAYLIDNADVVDLVRLICSCAGR